MKSGEFEAKSGHQNMKSGHQKPKSGHQKPKSGEQCKRRYSSLPIIILFIFIHKHYLFYVAAFSATFKLLKTKFFILATHCTNKSKSAEPRAEHQARLIAMPRRESFSAQAKDRIFVLS